MTFRLEVFIEDKALGDALHALARIKGVEIQGCPQPVVNRGKNGKAIAGSKMELAKTALDKVGTPFNVSDLKTHLKEVGIAGSAYYLQHWKKDRLVKLKSRGVWVKLPHKVA
jgi:hypothetical protein